jgi:hypothetical protein
MHKLIMAAAAAATIATSLIATSAPTYAQQRCQWIRTASGFINNCWGAQSHGQRCQWIRTASGFIRNCW